MCEEAERAKQEECAAAQRKKEAAATLMKSVTVVHLAAATSRQGASARARTRGTQPHACICMSRRHQPRWARRWRPRTPRCWSARRRRPRSRRRRSSASPPTWPTRPPASRCASPAGPWSSILLASGRRPPQAAMQRHAPACGMRGDRVRTAHAVPVLPDALGRHALAPSLVRIDCLVPLSRHKRQEEVRRLASTSTSWSCGWGLALLTWTSSAPEGAVLDVAWWCLCSVPRPVEAAACSECQSLTAALTCCLCTARQKAALK